MSVTPIQGIKSIQRGVLVIDGPATTATATVAQVNTSKAELRFAGSSSSSSQVSSGRTRLYLNNATTVGAIRQGTDAQANVTWELTEWY